MFRHNRVSVHGRPFPYEDVGFSEGTATFQIRKPEKIPVVVKHVVFWDIKTQFVPHRRHITSPLQSPAG
jgi:hypothetical protein